MLTRNPIKKAPAQVARVKAKVDPYEKARRGMKMSEAQETYRKTGEIKPFRETAERISEKTLGGSRERFAMEGVRSATEESEFRRKVKEAQQVYKERPGEETSAALKEVLRGGYDLYGKAATTGLDIRESVRGVETSEFARQLADIETDWETDPEAHKEEYTNLLNRQVEYYGENSFEGIKLQTKIRGVEEESLLNGMRNAKLAYETDPSAYKQFTEAGKALSEFYGSSEDGYYARKTLLDISDTEQTRLDSDTTMKFESGELGYEGYNNYLNASMSKYEEGSDDYMKYYKATRSLKFNKELDDSLRLQYSQPQGQVMQSLQSLQSQYQPGTTAFQEMQDNIDKLEGSMRYTAYQDMIGGVVEDNQKEINRLEVKLYTLQQDLDSDEISQSKFNSKYKKYNNKIEYLSSSYNLPRFELWKTY